MAETRAIKIGGAAFVRMDNTPQRFGDHSGSPTAVCQDCGTEFDAVFAVRLTKPDGSRLLICQDCFDTLADRLKTEGRQANG